MGDEPRGLGGVGGGGGARVGVGAGVGIEAGVRIRVCGQGRVEATDQSVSAAAASWLARPIKVSESLVSSLEQTPSSSALSQSFAT